MERQEMYRRELEKCMGEIKEILFMAQNRMGILESFIYLMKKESEIPKDLSPGLNGSTKE